VLYIKSPLTVEVLNLCRFTITPTALVIPTLPTVDWKSLSGSCSHSPFQQPKFPFYQPNYQPWPATINQPKLQSLSTLADCIQYTGGKSKKSILKCGSWTHDSFCNCGRCIVYEIPDLKNSQSNSINITVVILLTSIFTFLLSIPYNIDDF